MPKQQQQPRWGREAKTSGRGGAVASHFIPTLFYVTGRVEHVPLVTTWTIGSPISNPGNQQIWYGWPSILVQREREREMASFSLRSVVPKLQRVASSSLRSSFSMNPRLYFSTRSTRPMQAAAMNNAREVRDNVANQSKKAADAMKQGTKEVKRTAEDVKDMASSAADQVGQKTKEVANKVSEKAQDLGEKTKQTVQDAWETAKETTQKIKDTVVGKAEEAVKEEAENVKRAINSKN